MQDGRVPVVDGHAILDHVVSVFVRRSIALPLLDTPSATQSVSAFEWLPLFRLGLTCPHRRLAAKLARLDHKRILK